MPPLFQIKRRILPLSSNDDLNTPATTTTLSRRCKAKSMDLEAPEEANNKSLYLCNTETQLDKTSSAFVIHTVKLSDLLLSSSSSPVPLRKVASYTRGSPLPEDVGCGVLGSRIFFNGGLKLDTKRFLLAIPEKSVYTFDTKVPEKPITKIDANLNGAKGADLTKELCGKLYALPYWVSKNAASFEVFDPKLGSWECLPQPPFLTPGSRYYDDTDDYLTTIVYSYLVAGTKIFVSGTEFLSIYAPVKLFCPVFCFDAVHPEREWRKVPTMCDGGSFPFDNTALVLDLEDDDKKIVFAYTYRPWYLQLYLMSLLDNQETITEIGRFEIPKVAPKFGRPKTVKLIHHGGNKACVAVTDFNHALQYDRPEVVTNKHYGVMIPFQYELDTTKDETNYLTFNFLPGCYCFEYETDPCLRDQV